MISHILKISKRRKVCIMKKHEKYIICCPNCGKQLLKSKDGSELEIECPRCHSELTVVHIGTELKLHERISEYTAESK